MLYTWRKDGMKMLVNTDYKTFNNQTNLISSGNVIANTQYSNYIRKDYFEYDIKHFRLNRQALALATALNKQHTEFYLYEFYTYKTKNHNGNVIGWLFMSKDNSTCYYSIVNEDWYLYSKKQNVLDICKQIIQE